MPRRADAPLVWDAAGVRGPDSYTGRDGRRDPPNAPRRRPAPGRRRHGHVADRTGRARRHVFRAAERRGSRADRLHPSRVHPCGCRRHPHEHVRWQPEPPGRPRPRHAGRRAEPRRRGARSGRGRPLRRGVDGAARGPAGAVRAGEAGGCVRGVSRAGGGPRGGRCRSPDHRDADGPAGDGASARGRARGGAGHRRRRERHVHQGRSNAPRVLAGAGRRASHRARRGRDRRELRRGAGAAPPRDAAHAAGRRSRSARRAPERGRPHAGRRSVRVPGDARVPGGARTRVLGRWGVDHRWVLRDRPGSYDGDRGGDPSAHAPGAR